MGIKVGSYNSKDITLIVSLKSIEAFFQDTEVVIEKEEDSNTKSRALNGDVTYNESNDRGYTVTFSIKSDSEEHGFLRGLESSNTIFPCYYSNKATGEKMALIGCKFSKPANKSDGKELGGREWIIMVADGEELT